MPTSVVSTQEVPFQVSTLATFAVDVSPVASKADVELSPDPAPPALAVVKSFVSLQVDPFP